MPTAFTTMAVLLAVVSGIKILLADRFKLVATLKLVRVDFACQLANSVVLAVGVKLEPRSEPPKVVDQPVKVKPLRVRPDAPGTSNAGLPKL